MEMKKLETREYEAGATIMREGQIGKEMLILAKGKVEVSVEDVAVATVDTRGAFLGEISSLLGTRRIATLKAVEACKFYVVADLSKYFEENSESGFLIAKTLAGRLIDMNQGFVRVKKTMVEVLNSQTQDSTDTAAVQKLIDSLQKSLVGDVNRNAGLR